MASRKNLLIAKSETSQSELKSRSSAKQSTPTSPSSPVLLPPQSLTPPSAPPLTGGRTLLTLPSSLSPQTPPTPLLPLVFTLPPLTLPTPSQTPSPLYTRRRRCPRCLFRHHHCRPDAVNSLAAANHTLLTTHVTAPPLPPITHVTAPALLSPMSTPSPATVFNVDSLADNNSR